MYEVTMFPCIKPHLPNKSRSTNFPDMLLKILPNQRSVPYVLLKKVYIEKNAMGISYRSIHCTEPEESHPAEPTLLNQAKKMRTESSLIKLGGFPCNPYAITKRYQVHANIQIR
jgi:hypothetical protein